MNGALSTLVRRLDSQLLSEARVIPWSCPVPSFGDLARSRIATVGLNPSNREFVDSLGNELDGACRRLHTLKSLGLARWSDAKAQHLRSIVDSCRTYFSRNPYGRWFKTLDYIISGTRASYYGRCEKACHLDLIPYATACKWTGLTHEQRTFTFSHGWRYSWLSAPGISCPGSDPQWQLRCGALSKDRGPSF